MSKTHKFGFTKDEFISLHDTPGASEKDAVQLSDDMLNGKMMIIKAAPLYTGYTIDSFDWTRTPLDDSTATYQMYLFSLYPLRYAVKAYEITSDEKYITLHI